MDGTIVVKRLQFPIKLGYATTIDKAQGRTIASLVVDCYKLWKSAQMGVAMGRAICSKGLEIQNFNLVVATLKHPAIVTDFDAKPGIGVQGSKLCCNTRLQCIVNNPAVGVHAFNFQVGLNPAPNMANPIVEINDTVLTMQIEFLYDMNTFISSQLLPNITPRQKECNSIIEEFRSKKSLQDFILDAYNKILELFQMYKIPPQKTKCKWCVMCAVLNDYFTSAGYLLKVKK